MLRCSFWKKRKNEALKKEWEAANKGNNLKENEQESFFYKELSPIAKKYGFNFSYNDFCEYKKHSKNSNNYEELSDDELFNVAGGQAYECSIGPNSEDKNKRCIVYSTKW